MSGAGEGLRASSKPGGRLARSWRSLLDQVDRSYADRIARGRTIARGGRVHELNLAPGVVTAEVHDAGQVRHPTLRLSTLEPEVWDQVVTALQNHLAWPAALLEGELPFGLVQALAADEIDLLPTSSELDGDCDCGDFAVPCAHVAAIHHVLADALDGDPFVLFTLRGRPREQLLGAMRRVWGATPRRVVSTAGDTAPAERAWFSSPDPLPAMAFHFDEPTGTALSELGPLQGDEGLDRALAPLLSAGREAALRLALAEAPHSKRRRRRAHPPQRPEAPVATPTTEASTEPEALTEPLVDLLAENEAGYKTRDLATSLKRTVDEVRSELLQLEKLGIVYRTGQTRGTRWWLG